MNFDPQYTKVKNRLYTAGQGIVLFTIWDIIQAIMTIVFDENDILTNAGFYDISEVEQIFVIVFLIVCLIVIFATHFYVGRKAISLSNGKNKKNFFLVIDVLMILSSIAMITMSPIEFTGFNSTSIKSIVELVINLTETVILLEIMVYSIQFKKLSKEAK